MMWWLLGLAFADEAAVFTCCGDPTVEAMVKDYLKLLDVVSKGSDKSTSVAYLWASTTKTSAKKLADPADRKTAEDLLAVLDRVKNNAKDITASFDQISRPIVYLALNHASETGGLELVTGICGDRPWVQRAGAMAAPYQGVCKLQ